MESYLTAEISASAVRTNLELLRGLLGAGTGLCAAVKANCYGLGVDLLLPVISELADSLAVVTPQEAIQLRDLGYERDIIMLFSPGGLGEPKELEGALKELIAKRVTLTVVRRCEVASAATAAHRLGAEAEVHVMIDTGMTRSGVRDEQAPELIETIRKTEALKLTGLYTHFATADHSDKEFTREQLQRFLSTVDAAGARDGVTLHTANSAALIDLPETHLDMVRPGLAIYGYQPSDEMHTKLPLQPALRLWGRIMQVKDVPAGSRCGYGLTHTFQRDSRIGLVPVGYADGYFRHLSNNATMRVRDRDVAVCGRVSMDQTIIDLTDVPEAQLGDVVEIITPDPDAPNSVENIARLAGTIPNEVITALGHRAKRVLVD